MMNASQDTDRQEVDDQKVPVTTHQSSPNRTVFTESGNTDAWIATDTVVTPEQ
jgi:hypothetical protein